MTKLSFELNIAVRVSTGQLNEATFYILDNLSYVDKIAAKRGVHNHIILQEIVKDILNEKIVGSMATTIHKRNECAKYIFDMMFSLQLMDDNSNVESYLLTLLDLSQ